ncbi:MAG: type II toxin-antitoxin system RelE/ParE family toxin [Cyanobacteria bacterium P01_H01_bin.152]
MTYRIDLSSVAQAEADAAFLSLTQYTTPERAQAWYQGMMKAISSLKTMPRRCPVARESAFFSQEIRQLLYGQGKHRYRILFAILDDHPTPTVWILHIRNVAQRAIGEPDDAEE